MLEPLDIGDDEWPDVDGLSFTELVQLHEVLEWENVEADAVGQALPHPDIGVPPPNVPGVEGSSPFVSRAGWGGRTPTCHPTNFSLEGLTLHYSGPSPWTGVDRSSVARFLATALHSRCASIWRSFEAFHMDSRGGCCIFYHSAGCPHGVRFEGRPHTMRSGAQGTDDGNFRSFGVQTLMGLGDPLTDASKAAILDEEQRLGAPFRWGHKDWRDASGNIRTACPGDPAYDWRLAGFPSPTSEVDVIESDFTRIEAIFRAVVNDRTVTGVRGQVERAVQLLALSAGNVVYSTAEDSIYRDSITLPKVLAAVNQIEGVDVGPLLEAIKGIEVDVDEAGVAAAVLAVLTPEAIAAAIPNSVAQQVVDELHARLAA